MPAAAAAVPTRLMPQGGCATEAAPPPPHLPEISQLLRKACLCCDGDEVAIQSRGARLTRAELLRRSAAVGAAAARLAALPREAARRRRHPTRHTVVALQLPRSPALYAALLGVWEAGLTAVIIPPATPQPRRAQMLRTSGASLTISRESLLPEALEGLEGAEGLEVAEPQHTDSGAKGVDPTEALGEGAGGQSAGSRQPPSAAGGFCPYVSFTSGSTGQPKGVVVRESGVLNAIRDVASRIGAAGFAEKPPPPPPTTPTPTPAPLRWLAVSPEHFDISFLEVLLPLLYGLSVVLHCPADGFSVAEDIARFQPDVLQATPATWEMLLLAGWDPSPAARPHVRLVGGEVFPPALARRLLGEPLQSSRAEAEAEEGPPAGHSCHPATAAAINHSQGRHGLAPLVANLYGPTEATIWVTFAALSLSSIHPQHGVPLGEPLVNNTLALGEGDVPLEAGPAELVVRGANVAWGYLLPEQGGGGGGGGGAAARWRRFEGCVYRTGDWVVRDPATGGLFFLQRHDDQVKVRGNRVELGEVSACAMRAPGIRAAACIASGEGAFGHLRLFYTTDTTTSTNSASPGGNPHHRGLLRHLRDSLPQYMVPTHVVHLEDGFPLNPSGKICLKALRDIPCSGGAPTAAQREADFEQVMCRLVSRVVEAEERGEPVAPGYTLHPGGIDSIGILMLSKAIEAELRQAHPGGNAAALQGWSGVEDGVPLVLASPTVAALAARVLASIPGLRALYPATPPAGGGSKKKPSRSDLAAQRGGGAAAAAADTSKKAPKAKHPLLAAASEGSLAGVAEVLGGDDRWGGGGEGQGQPPPPPAVPLETSDKFGSTAVHYAAGGGHLEVLVYLIWRGASCTVPDKKSGRTALHWAARNGHQAVCEHLVDALGCELGVKAKDDTTPLQLAAWGGHIETCRWLMSRGGDILFINKWGCSAMHFATLAGHLEAAQWLHSLGLDLGHCNYQGHNAIHKAAYGGHRELCDWLIRGPPGLPLTRPDVRGQYPHTLAAKAGYEALAVHLASLGSGRAA